jgi:Mg/Co/Ni transporter MgtE
LFSAAPDLVEFGRSAYRQRSEETNLLLRQLFERFREEDLAMSYTMEDFKRDYVKKHFAQLTSEEQEEALRALPPEKQEEVSQALPLERRLAGLSAEQIRQYLDRLNAERPAKSRKPRRKK